MYQHKFYIDDTVSLFNIAFVITSLAYKNWKQIQYGSSLILCKAYMVNFAYKACLLISQYDLTNLKQCLQCIETARSGYNTHPSCDIRAWNRLVYRIRQSIQIFRSKDVYKQAILIIHHLSNCYNDIEPLLQSSMYRYWIEHVPNDIRSHICDIGATNWGFWSGLV